MACANSAVPSMDASVYAKAVEYYQSLALSYGITNVFEPLFDSLRDYGERAKGYQMLDEAGRQQYYPEIDPTECAEIPFVLSYRDKLRAAQLQILRNYFEPEVIFETDTLSSLISITASSECGTVIPETYMTLFRYDTLPLFFRLSIATPPWPFALSLPKSVGVVPEAVEYIRLFLDELVRLKLFDTDLSADAIIGKL